METFVLAYDVFAGNFTITQLFSFIRDNKHVHQHYTPFAGCYVLKSAAGAAILEDTFRGFFENSQFIIAKIDATQTGGMLPQNVWPWVYSGNVPSIGN